MANRDQLLLFLFFFLFFLLFLFHRFLHTKGISRGSRTEILMRLLTLSSSPELILLKFKFHTGHQTLTLGIAPYTSYKQRRKPVLLLEEIHTSKLHSSLSCQTWRELQKDRQPDWPEELLKVYRETKCSYVIPFLYLRDCMNLLLVKG